MTGAELAAVLTAASSLLAAVTALVHALRTRTDLRKHVVRQAVIAARTASDPAAPPAHCK